jgi:hypothetical protein
MGEGIMSADVLFAGMTKREAVRSQKEKAREAERWNPEDFAREQIRGLVRQVFFSNAEWPVRQVVFSALGAETDVKSICRRVGEALALETQGNIAVVGEYPQALPDAETETIGLQAASGTTPLQQGATRVRGNLWLVPPAEKTSAGRNSEVRNSEDQGNTARLHSHLGQIRREFEYSIVEGPAAGESNEATAMAQFADGIILVLSANRTRRISARKIKEMLEGAHARILGTVLSDRDFPIPEGIYRRL